MPKDSAIAQIPTNAKQFVRPRSAPVSLRNSIASTRALNSAEAWANKVGPIDLNRPGGSVDRPYLRIRVFRTRTSIIPDPARPSRVYLTDEHPPFRASPRTRLTRSPTLAPLSLPVVRVATPSVARETQISQRRNARDH